MSGVGDAGGVGAVRADGLDASGAPGATAPELAAAPLTAAQPPPVIRGSVPARPVIGSAPIDAPAVSQAARQPIPEAEYGPILKEAETADWTGVGIDADRYVADRFNMKDFIQPLLENPDRKVVLHRNALKISHVKSIDGSSTFNVAHRRAKDYPGRAYFSREDNAYHMVAIPGEDWYRQTLHMLATAGVPTSQIDVEGTFDPEPLMAEDLDETLDEHDFDSVTVGTMGELTKAIERVLRERVRPAHTEQVLGRMGVFLEDRAQNARADKRPRWEERSHRLAAIRATGAPALAQLDAVRADPVLSGPLGELIRSAEEGPNSRKLPWTYRTRGGDLLAHRTLEVDGKKHLVIHVGTAHGDLAYHAVRYVLKKEPDLSHVNMYGSAGSFTEDIPPDTFIVPETTIRSGEEDRPALDIVNSASLPGGLAVAHSNVSTLLREHKAGIERITGLPAETVDIESYHVARAAGEAGRPIDLRAILRISDVASSADLGAHREDRAETSDYDGRRVGEEQTVIALGLVEPGEASATDGDGGP